MTRPILVAYATKHGSTQQVAQTIAAMLRKESLAVDTRPVADVTDLDSYDGVVLGAALYMGRLHVDARRFLRRHCKDLESTPLAVFAMGPLTDDEKQVEGSQKQLQHALSKLPGVRPVSTAIFGGVVRPSELHFPFSHMPASDARDWKQIEQWALEIARAFGRRPVAAAPA
jgi:menaquinone-dependent protoporphyrinogen oxidase